MHFNFSGKALSTLSLLLLVSVLFSFRPTEVESTPSKEMGYKGIIVEIDDTFFRESQGEEDPIVLLSPNHASQQQWIYAHGIKEIIDMRVVDTYGSTLVTKDIRAAAFHMYTGELDPGVYYIVMKVAGEDNLISRPLVIEG
ncbi:MAG: hypothetical protein AAF789_10115 [Bacteroidota bacterium]